MERVRTAIDRIPLAGENTNRPEAVLESPSETVGSSFLLRQIYAGLVDLAADCSLIYLPGLETIYKGPFDGFSQDEMLRPAISRVYRKAPDGEFYSCRARTIGQHNYLEGGTGRGATPQEPAYTYEGGDLRVFPENEGEDHIIKIVYIQYPDRIRLSDVPDDPDTSQEYPHAPAFDPSVGGDELPISHVLVEPLVRFVTAKANRQLSRPNQREASMQWYEFFRKPYLRTWHFGRPEDYKKGMRPEEKEENTEY